MLWGILGRVPLDVLLVLTDGASRVLEMARVQLYNSHVSKSSSHVRPFAGVAVQVTAARDRTTGRADKEKV